MMTTENSIQVKTDMSLWNFLFRDMVISYRTKFTKVEAFYDLLRRQKFAIIEGQDDLPGNYQTLADRWGWHRMTVKRFLEDLAAIGAVSIEQLTNRTVIRVIGMSVANGDVLNHSLLQTGNKLSAPEIPP